MLFYCYSKIHMLTFLFLHSCALFIDSQDKEFSVTTPNQPEDSILPVVDAVVDSYGSNL